MINDLLNSIKANLYGRATSPLFGTFIISWAAWNYKFILVLSSSLSFHQKIDYIQSVLFPDGWAMFLYGFAIPLVAALAFIFLYPYPAKWIYAFARNRQKELKEIKQKIEDETPLTIEESRNLKRQILKLEMEHEGEIYRKNEQIATLKQYLTEQRKNEK